MTGWLPAVVTALASTSVLSVDPDPVPGLWIKGRGRAHPAARSAVYFEFESS